MQHKNGTVFLSCPCHIH